MFAVAIAIGYAVAYVVLKVSETRRTTRPHAGGSMNEAVNLESEEFPNRLLPNGATRDLEAVRQGRQRGKALLSAEQFELLHRWLGRSAKMHLPRTSELAGGRR